MEELISRQKAKDAIDMALDRIDHVPLWVYDNLLNALNEVPPAQPERDKPMKPIKTTDRAWGIPKKQAVCPKCDYYLGHVSFLGDYKGKRITYCETCGQAIDWEGWDSDE